MPTPDRPTPDRPAAETAPAVPSTSRPPAPPAAADPWASVLLVLSAARSVLGAAAFVAPVTGSVLLGIDRSSAVRMSWATRAFANRDFAVGLLGIAGARQGGAAVVRTAFLTGAVCDAGDALTFLLALRDRQIGRGRGTLLVLSSAGAATLGWVASQRTQQ